MSVDCDVYASKSTGATSRLTDNSTILFRRRFKRTRIKTPKVIPIAKANIEIRIIDVKFIFVSFFVPNVALLMTPQAMVGELLIGNGAAVKASPYRFKPDKYWKTRVLITDSIWGHSFNNQTNWSPAPVNAECSKPVTWQLSNVALLLPLLLQLWQVWELLCMVLSQVKTLASSHSRWIASCTKTTRLLLSLLDPCHFLRLNLSNRSTRQFASCYFGAAVFVKLLFPTTWIIVSLVLYQLLPVCAVYKDVVVWLLLCVELHESS